MRIRLTDRFHAERRSHIWRRPLRAGAWLVVLAASSAVSAATFVVAPAGNDRNPGTKERPLATLQAARDAARLAGARPHCIRLQEGEYFLTAPLELDSRDNGLTIQPEPDKKATLYGGRAITGWRRTGEQLWEADLPGVKEGRWDFRALVVNGRLADRACYPATGAFENRGTWNLPLLPAVAGHWERKPTHEELTRMPYDPQDIPATLDVRNAEVRLYHMWAESLVGVDRNDTQGHTLVLSSEPAWPPGALGRRKYVIYNTREGMSRPGQWFLDRTAGRLVYWPLPGEDLARVKILAPTTERVIRISGTPRAKAERISLRGLTLQSTTAPLKPASFGAGAFDGAVSLNEARQCTVEDLEICNVGGLGIRGDNLSECRITGCRVHHVGPAASGLTAPRLLSRGTMFTISACTTPALPPRCSMAEKCIFTATRSTTRPIRASSAAGQTTSSSRT